MRHSFRFFHNNSRPRITSRPFLVYQTAIDTPVERTHANAPLIEVDSISKIVRHDRIQTKHLQRRQSTTIAFKVQQLLSKVQEMCSSHGLDKLGSNTNWHFTHSHNIQTEHTHTHRERKKPMRYLPAPRVFSFIPLWFCGSLQ